MTARASHVEERIAKLEGDTRIISWGDIDWLIAELRAALARETTLQTAIEDNSAIRAAANQLAENGRETRALRSALTAARAALLFGIGCALNELAADGLPFEWAPDSGIGVMAKALGLTTIEEIRKALAGSEGKVEDDDPCHGPDDTWCPSCGLGGKNP